MKYSKYTNRNFILWVCQLHLVSKKKEVYKMKHKLLKVMQIALLVVATMSANTPSQAGLYQPKIPDKLKSLK